MTITFEEVKKVIPTLQIKYTRKPKADGRMGCGLGYTVTVKGSHGTYTTTYTITYNNSKPAGYETPDKMDILYCVLSDANCYEYTQDLKDFCLEFGYNEPDEFGYKSRMTDGRKAYNACKRAHKRLNEIFTKTEIEKLQELFQDY